MTQERQQELFGEFKAEKERRPFGKGFFPDKTFSFTFTYEKLIMIIVGSIIFTTIIFAFGFEKGRRAAFTRRSAPRAVSTTPQAPTPATRPASPATEKTIYMIKVATFKSKEYAQQEAQKLRKKKFPTTIIGISGFYQVYAGEYSEMKDALGALNVLRKVYPDCEIRKR